MENYNTLFKAGPENKATGNQEAIHTRSVPPTDRPLRIDHEVALLYYIKEEFRRQDFECKGACEGHRTGDQQQQERIRILIQSHLIGRSTGLHVRMHMDRVRRNDNRVNGGSPVSASPGM